MIAGPAGAAGTRQFFNGLKIDFTHGTSCVHTQSLSLSGGGVKNVMPPAPRRARRAGLDRDGDGQLLRSV